MCNRSSLLVALGMLSVLTVTSTAVGGSSSAAAEPLLGQPFPADVMAASAAPDVEWTPDPPTFGVGKTANVPATMGDGTNLRADVYYPTGPDGQRAAGRFPVLMTQTPYGRGMLGQLPESVLGTQHGGGNEYLVRRGYISVVVDVRGTGGSEGSFGALDPVQASDGATLVGWAAKLPGSNGKVGLYGASYLAFNQLLTAAAVGENSPLKAIFPIAAANDLYKDVATMGGLVDSEFPPFFVGLMSTLNSVGPVVNGLQDPGRAVQSLNPVAAQHLRNVIDVQAPLLVELMTGQAVAFNDEFWQARNPGSLLQQIVDNGIPAYLVGGHYDLLQRGAPLNYVGLQNASAGRPITAPMLPDQTTTGRYQLLLTSGGHLATMAGDISALQLRWFDTFLKGRDTGMENTPTPLHVHDLGTGDYVHSSQYPYPDATPTRYYLGDERSGSAPLSRNDGTLTATPPSRPGADTVPWVPVGNPCGRAVDQWGFGAISLVTDRLPATVPCIDNDAPGTLGVDRLTYTSAPLPDAKTIAGPIAMTLFASATTSESAWVVQVDDVAPDGTSKPLTQGALLGSLRKLDPATTWRAPDGEIIQAGHTYSRSSQEPVVSGETTRYDIEVFPTYATLTEGHRIRITLSTGDFPHLTPTVPAALRLLGGIYTVRYGAETASAIQIPLIDAGP